MRFNIKSRSGGTTLLETLIGVGISMFLFSYLSFLLFFSGRNMHNIHEQLLGQNSAGTASERCVGLLRDACYYNRFGEDESTTEGLTRIQFALPRPGNTITTHSLVYDAAKRELCYYEAGGDSGTPAMRFANIADFSIEWRSQYRLVVRTGFVSHGFALHGPSSQGQNASFETGVIARNHFLGKGVENYADDDASSGPACL